MALLLLNGCSADTVLTENTAEINPQEVNLQEVSLQEIDPLKDPVRIESWTEDVDYLVEQLTSRQRYLYTEISEATFNAEIELLKNRISNLTDDEITVEIMKLLNRIGDAHTNVLWYSYFDENRLPVKLVFLNDALYCINASKEYEDMIFKKNHENTKRRHKHCSF